MNMISRRLFIGEHSEPNMKQYGPFLLLDLQHLPTRIDLIDFVKHLNIKPTITGIQLRLKQFISLFSISNWCHLRSFWYNQQPRFNQLHARNKLIHGLFYYFISFLSQHKTLKDNYN